MRRREERPGGEPLRSPRGLGTDRRATHFAGTHPPGAALAAIAAIAALLPLVGCGPTLRETGTAVGLLGPFVFATSTGLTYLLVLLWRHVSPTWIELPRTAWLVALGAHVALALLVAAGGVPGEAAEWLGIGYWVFGTSHAAVSLVLWRLWHWRDPAGALAWGPITASILLLPAAVPVAWGSLSEAAGDAVMGYLWIWPGYAGWVPGGLFVVFLLEGIVRLVVLRRRERWASEGP